MFQENPVLVAWLRGGEVEAQNRGAFCLYRGDEVVAMAGGAEDRCFLRSGAKSFQAAAGILAGIEARFGLGDRELALMCASHGGEPDHVAVARGMLARAGLDARHLRCGAHPPLHAPSAAELRRRGEEPSALHNNCSGKHAGMLLAAAARNEPLDSYLEPDHPHQRRIRELVAAFAEAAPGDPGVHVDGCSAPTFVLPLRAAARAFRNFGAPPQGLGAAAGAAAARLRRAVAAEPLMLAGHGRFCSAIAGVTKGRVLVKVGADGFYGAMVPEARAGLALHVDDGAAAASERLLAAVLHRHGLLSGAEVAALRPYLDPVRRNHAGLVVGEVRVTLP